MFLHSESTSPNGSSPALILTVLDAFLNLVASDLCRKFLVIRIQWGAFLEIIVLGYTF